MKIVCVIPTYNEKENISLLIKKIQQLYPDIHILVVDDNSPDGTGKIVEKMKNEHLDVLHRSKKEGLGRAYISGFQKVLKDGADIIIQMDADLSHDPLYIKDFLKHIKENDVVIGSRYIDGVSIVHWPLSRLIISCLGNVYARVMTGMKILDLTGGFKCMKRGALKSIDFRKIKTNGYGFQVEMDYAFWKNGMKIKEIPIIFYKRIRGSSHMTKRIVLEAMLKTPFFRFKRYRKIVVKK